MAKMVDIYVMQAVPEKKRLRNYYPSLFHQNGKKKVNYLSTTFPITFKIPTYSSIRLWLQFATNISCQEIISSLFKNDGIANSYKMKHSYIFCPFSQHL